MKRIKLLLLLTGVLALSAVAGVRSFDGDPKPPCLPGTHCIP